ISRRRHSRLHCRRPRDRQKDFTMAPGTRRGLIASLLALAFLRAASAQSTLEPPLVKLLHDIKAADSDQLAVSEEDGRFLRVMAASSGAKRALEIGAANGYSAIWIGLGLRQTGGRLTTIAYEPARARDAAHNVRRAGLAG